MKQLIHRLSIVIEKGNFILYIYRCELKKEGNRKFSDRKHMVKVI